MAIEAYCPITVDMNIPQWSWIERYNLGKLVHQYENLECLR